MTKDEAIIELSVLWERFHNGMGWRDGDYEAALDIAINTLEDLEETDRFETDDGVIKYTGENYKI